MRYIPGLQNGYTGHLDVQVHPGTGDTYHAIGHNISAGGKNKRNLLIMHRDRQGRYTVIREYKEDIDYQGPLGACALALIPNGNILVMLAMGNEKDQVWAAEDTLLACHPPYRLLS